MAKPAKPTFSLLDHLEKEVKVKPFTAEIAEDVVITFPNPMEMRWQESQRFMEQMSAENASVGEVFSEWLSAEDYKALEEADVTMGALMELAKAVGDHYSSAFGTPGE